MNGSGVAIVTVLQPVRFSKCVPAIYTVVQTPHIHTEGTVVFSVVQWLECLTFFEVGLLKVVVQFPMPSPLPIWISTTVYNLD